MTRFRLRRGWLLIHKWIGLAIAVLVIPVSLSGAALVWRDALDRAVHPARYATSGDRLMPIGAYVAAAEARLSQGERIARLTLPERGGPVIVAATPAASTLRSGPPVLTELYLDPPTARVLDMAYSAAGPVRFLHALHGSLQIPAGWGRPLVGWPGVALLLSSLSGLWLWWPTVGPWTQGLRWRRRPDANANLHHLFGFWTAVPLFVLALTGAWISFPKAFGALVGEGWPRGPDRSRQALARPVARAALGVDQAVARALAVAPGRAERIDWPTERTPDWSVEVAGGARRTVSVADDAGVAALAPERPGQGPVAGWMRRIHEGDGMGPVWRTVIFLSGILSAVLAVTGPIMWWRTRRR